MPTLSEWYKIAFDHWQISLDIELPSGEARQDRIQWDDIQRVCFAPGDFLESDEIYIFVNHRPESFRIPVEAAGGFELWMEIIRRGLFDAQLALQATAANAGVFCWPTG